MGLAPIAVLPEFQGNGIGSRLVSEGMKIVKAKNSPFLVVLGHSSFYQHFGFKKASFFGLQCQWDNVPDDAFMAIIFDEQVLNNVTGIVKYRDEFNQAV